MPEKEKLGEDLPINSPKEYELIQKFETLRLEPTKTYTLTLPEIAEKLENGIQLNEIERYMAAATIFDWIRLKESQKGRPKKWHSIQEKNRYYNDKRRGKSGENK